MTEALGQSCSRCGTAISNDDLGGGLAVRVDGQLVCQMCVDTLPGEAVVRINQVRALRGLEATTYLVKLERAPRLQLYSFTTSSNITNHRRKLASDGFFEAPPLPPPAERQRLPPPSTPKVVTDRVARGQMPERKAMLIAAGATVVVLGGIALAFALASSGKKPLATATPSGTAEVPLPAPAKALKTRLDYPADPLQAWTQASQDRECPALVRQGIAQDLIRKRTGQLDDADTALAERRLEDANALASALALPDDIDFRDLRRREDELRNRLLTSRTVATPPSIAHAPLPGVEPSTVVPPPTAPAPAPAPAPLSERQEIRLQAENADVTGTSIEHSKRGNIHALINWHSAAHHARWTTTVTTPGNYRVDVRYASSGGSCAMLIEIAGQRIAGTLPTTGGWSTFRMGSLGVVTLPAGEVSLIVGAQDPATWHAVNLAELDLVSTTEAASPQVPAPVDTAVTPPPTPTPAPKPVEPASQVTAWTGAFVTGPRDKPPRRIPLDGSENVPAGLPGGATQLFRSLKSQTLKHHALFLDLAGAPAVGGGVVLLVHAARSDRTELIPSLTDAKGTTVKLDPIPLNDDQWTTVVVPMPKEGLDASHLLTLALEDGPKASHIPDDSGFFVAAAACVSGRAGTPADLGVRPSALLPDPNRMRNLPRLLDILAKNRKKANSQKFIEPNRLRFVLGSWSKSQDWRVSLRRQVEPLIPGKPPAAMMSDFSFSDTWLDSMTKAKDAALDPAAIHIGVLWSGGDELGTFPEPPQAVGGFWKRRLDQILDAGVLPIVVIGPNRQKDAARAQADQLWQQFVTLAPVRLYAMPVIDLRALPTADDGSWDAATAALAAQLVADAIGETVFNLRRLGAIK